MAARSNETYIGKTCVYTVGKRGGSYDVPHVIRKRYNPKTVDSSVREKIWPEVNRSAN